MALRVYVGVFEPETAARTAEALRPLVDEGLIVVTGDDQLRSALGTGAVSVAGKSSFGGAQVIVMLAGSWKIEGRSAPLWLYADAQRQASYGARVMGVVLSEEGRNVLKEANIRISVDILSHKAPFEVLAEQLRAMAIHGGVSPRLTHMRVKNLGPFQDVELSFTQGINVFIGGNATGKSTLLKLLYGASRELSVNSQPGIPSNWTPGPALEFLRWPFWGPADEPVDRLLRDPGNPGNIDIQWTTARCEAWIRPNGGGGGGGPIPEKKGTAEPIYLPAHEVLSLAKNSLWWLDERRLPVDGTIYDLCRALSRAELPVELRPAYTQDLLQELERVLDGQPQQRGDGSFYLLPSAGNKPLIAELVAEGLRKIATLYRLIEVGALSPGTILFWDEPEANMNPALAQTVVRVIQILANNGVQVFVATHDYLFLYRLGMEARYPDVAHHGVTYRFFSLTREGTGPVDVQQADRLEDLEHNLILEANELFFDERRRRAAAAEEKEG